MQANIVEKESGARQRPGFDALLKRLQPGNSLVAWKVDRLGRDALAALTVAYDLDARGVRIVITTLGVDSSKCSSPLLVTAEIRPSLARLCEGRTTGVRPRGAKLRPRTSSRNRGRFPGEAVALRVLA